MMAGVLWFSVYGVMYTLVPTVLLNLSEALMELLPSPPWGCAIYWPEATLPSLLPCFHVLPSAWHGGSCVHCGLEPPFFLKWFQCDNPQHWDWLLFSHIWCGCVLWQETNFIRRQKKCFVAQVLEVMS